VIKAYQLDVAVSRGEVTESEHRVHAAVVGDGDELLGTARDANSFTYWRSCAKPFQVLPFLGSGGFDALGWGEEQLAISCASHGGEPEHVAIVEKMLRDIGLEEGDLACGPHDPSSQRGAKIVRESGDRPTRLHNNCSGKHSAMLAMARRKGWATRGYEGREHNVQRAILHEISLWTGVPCGKITQAVDGCGVVVFGMTLERMARAYSRLAVAAARGEEIPKRVVGAMSKLPGDAISVSAAAGYAIWLGLLALVAGSVAFALAGFVGRGSAVGIAGTVMFAGFILNGYQAAIPALAPLENLTWFG